MMELIITLERIDIASVKVEDVWESTTVVLSIYAMDFRAIYAPISM